MALAHKMPQLENRLRQANLRKTPEQFLKQVLVSAMYTTILIVVIVGFIFAKSESLSTILISIFPILFLFMVFYFLQLPVVKAKVIERELEREVVYAGRFIVIELQSGVSLYDAFYNVAKNYPAVGEVFRGIVQSIDLGSSMTEAIDDALDACPSANVRKILLQIKNSLRSGSDVTGSLSETVNQITQEQMIAVKEYGKKLNPFVMFFMMTAVIMPSLGATAFIVLGSFMSITVDLTILLIFVFFLALFQLMFLNMIKSSRPPVDI